MPRHFFIPLVLALATSASAAPDLQLPTENLHLFGNQPERFYMYVDRIFEGETSKPWEGGSYGYVRTAQRIGGDVILTKFHEGIDISPVKRDRAGNPLDLVSSISGGVVVHTSPIAGRSNYGKYVVVEHQWEDTSIYSLYAHLAEVTCKPGDPVKAGSVLGRMGYTGAGINRTRAHLHLELGMLMSRHYEDWHKACAGGTNYHGIFNGMNLAGADVARFFLEHKKNPEFRFSDLVGSTEVYFKVAVPAKGTPDFVRRHPWICRTVAEEEVPSWEISFSATGLPVSFEPGAREVSTPTVIAVRPSRISHGYLTRWLLEGSGNRATLTAGGRKLVALLMDDFPISKEQAMDAKPAKSRG